MALVDIDGSMGEGGGQIVRTAIALSAVTARPCSVHDIRAGRPKPGLKAQHVAGITALKELCGADISGLELSSSELGFHPGRIKGGRLEVEIATAGSIGLVLQALMIPLAHAEKRTEVVIRGGATAGKWAPPLAYIQHVILPMLYKMGYRAEIKVDRHGFYPKGGASARMVVEPQKELEPLVLDEPCKATAVEGVSHASKHLEKARVAERQAAAAARIIEDSLGIRPSIKSSYSDTRSAGTCIVLWALTGNSLIGADSLGALGVPAETIGQRAARALVDTVSSGASVDEHASDQLLPYMALAAESSGRKSVITAPRLTGHAETNMAVIEKFIPVKFSAAEARAARTIARIECRRV